MTELRMNVKKGEFKRFLSWFLTVCLCVSMVYMDVQAADKQPSIRLNKERVLGMGEDGTLTATIMPDGKQDSSLDDGKQDSSSDDGVASVSLEPKSISLNKGEVAALIVSILPVTAKDKTVTWSTSNPKVAIAQDGKVTAIGGGTAIITARTNSGGHTAACIVTVTERVSGIKLNKKSLTLSKGKSQTLKATISPKTASDKSVTWSTSNPSVATVKNGKVTAKKVGTAVINVQSGDGGYTASCKVTVVIPATKVTFSKQTVYVAKGKTVKVLATMTPENTTDTITWSSSNKKAATVKNGKITGKMAGQAKITAKTTSGKKATINVVVSDEEVAAESIVLDKNDVILQVGKKLTIKSTVSPANSTDTIKWISNNEKVVSVNEEGSVTIKKAGTATITARTSSGKIETCRITVPGIVLRKSSATIKVKKTVNIKVKFSTVKGDKVKSYQSSDEDVATVTKKGKVKGREEGTATITVTMMSGAKAKFKVRVKE